MRMPETEPGPSVRAVNALNGRVIFLVPRNHFWHTGWEVKREVQCSSFCDKTDQKQHGEGKDLLFVMSHSPLLSEIRAETCLHFHPELFLSREFTHC